MGKERIQIVTDSTASIPQELVGRHGIKIVPIYFAIGNDDYLDGVNITQEEALRRITLENEPPKTAAPSPEIFKEIFEKHPGKSLGIFLGSTYSKVWESGIMASNELGKDKAIIYDSGTTTHGLGYMVIKAAEWAETGLSIDKIIKNLDNLSARTKVFAALDSLYFAGEGGRIPKFLTKLGLRPVIKIALNRKVELVDKTRTRRKSLEKLQEKIKENKPLEFASVVHAGATKDELEMITNRIKENYNGPTWSGIIGPALLAHAGPKAIGLALVTRR